MNLEMNSNTSTTNNTTTNFKKDDKVEIKENSKQNESNEEEDNEVDNDINENNINLDKFLYNYDKNIEEDELSQDSYERRLDKEIEANCDFKVYVDKLEVEEKNEDDLLKMEKNEILAFKNEQIKKYKAYIASLEKEKEDLIDNFKDTTSILLERIKEYEERSYGERPQTAIIMDGIKQRQGFNHHFNNNIEDNRRGNNPFNNNFNNNKVNIGLTNQVFELDNNSTKNSNNQQERCVKCKSFFPKDEFAKHSLMCLRKPLIVCKICQESIEEKDKESHISYFKDPETIIKSIDDKNLKLYENCLNHNFAVENTLLNKTKGFYLIHYLCYSSTTHQKFLSVYIKRNFKLHILTSVNKETPLVRHVY